MTGNMQDGIPWGNWQYFYESGKRSMQGERFRVQDRPDSAGSREVRRVPTDAVDSPSARTETCTAEAIDFSRLNAAFKNAGAVLIGIAFLARTWGSTGSAREVNRTLAASRQPGLEQEQTERTEGENNGHAVFPAFSGASRGGRYLCVAWP